MAKKKRTGKKYVNPIKQQKEQEAQYRNIFTDKLRNLCLQIGGDASLFRQIPATEKMLIYMFRGAPLKVVATEGAKIPKRLMDAIVKIIKTQQLLMKMEVVKGSGQMMTFADYFLVGQPLEYIMSNEEAVFPGKERFDSFMATQDERMLMYEDKVKQICSTACLIFDDMESRQVYTYSFELSVPAVEKGSKSPTNKNCESLEWLTFARQELRMHQKVTIGTYPLEVRKISINGETHSGIAVGGASPVDDKQVFYPFTIPVEDLNIDTPFSKLPLPVYIQQHALGRMRERIGNVPRFAFKKILIDSLVNKEYVPITKTRFLMAAFNDALKIGYFVLEIVEGIALIRTFLLLTNSGTPEGDKLAKLTGLQIDDRKYLAIDTLPGLANSDIAQNEAICNKFRAAGCGSILELCKKMNSDPGMMWLMGKPESKNIISDLITEYLKPNDEEDEDEIVIND